MNDFTIAIRFFIVAFILSLIALAAHAEDRTPYCTEVAAAWQSAVVFRDTGATPMEALENAEQYPLVPLQVKKNIINLIYFHPTFTNVTMSSNLHERAFLICMGEVKPIARLK